MQQQNLQNQTTGQTWQGTPQGNAGQNNTAPSTPGAMPANR